MMDGLLRVTKLTRDPRGWWTANISLNGTTVRVDNSTGAWVAPEGKRSAREERAGRHVMPDVADVLQKKVRREEKRAAREASKLPGPQSSPATNRQPEG